MSGRARALVLAFSPIASAPRVARQLRALAPHFEVTSAGFGSAPESVKEHVELPPPRGTGRISRLARLAARRFQTYYWNLPHVARAREALRGQRFDLIAAHEVHTLPLALEAANGAAILLDAHEFAPREFEDRLSWRLLYAPYVDWACRRYLPRAHAMTTVAPGIADAYLKDYGTRADVVYSAPPRASLNPSATGDRVRMVHHGAAMPSRRIEAVIELMDLLDERFELDFVLVPGDPDYLARLREKAERNVRIRFLPPVRMPEIVGFCNRYDAGLYLLPPNSFNSAHALPNKFFEFIQARLAVAIGPSPEMKRLVDQYGCGIVSEDFSPASMAHALSALTPGRLAELKAASHRAADELCWERQEPVFLAAVERAMETR